MIYLHIPFCRQACHYCDFHFSTNLKGVEEMLKAIGTEGELMAPTWRAHGPPKTLYLGGGTPSLVPLSLLKGLYEKLEKAYDLSQLTEFTLEANPEDVTQDLALAWKALGVTRISLGVQSLDGQILASLNRSHTAEDALAAVKTLQVVGLPEISVDLIFGLPGQTLSGFKADVERMLALEVGHISLYGLTIEERTVFGHRVAKAEMPPPDEDLLADMMAWLGQRLAQAGYIGYEISNYALPGHEAKHNAAYWDGVPYLGLGPSAHSYDGVARWANPASNALYLQAIQRWHNPLAPQEILSPQDRFNEGLLTGLRLSKGIDIEGLASQTNQSPPPNFWKQVSLFEAEGYLTQEDQRLFLTTQGRLLADFITRKLML
jgi:oxygen-independent coproporphyrinogen III oxidase